jgi:uncharacterized protein with GYD domain
MATKATPFTFTVTISAKEVKEIADQLVDYAVDCNYSDEAIKAAGVKSKDLAEQVMADPKFLKEVGKAVQRTIDCTMSDIYDDMADMSFKCLDAAEKAVAAAERKLEATYEERERDARIKAAKSLLESNGFHVSK